jgi:hypothetical protein
MDIVKVCFRLIWLLFLTIVYLQSDEIEGETARARMRRLYKLGDVVRIITLQHILHWNLIVILHVAWARCILSCAIGHAQAQRS